MLKELFLILFLVFLGKCGGEPVPCELPMTHLCRAEKIVEKIISIAEKKSGDRSPSMGFLEYFQSDKHEDIMYGVLSLKDELRESDVEAKSKWNSFKVMRSLLGSEYERDELTHNIELFIMTIDEIFEKFLNMIVDNSKNLYEVHYKFRRQSLTTLQNIRNQIAPLNTSSGNGPFFSLIHSLIDEDAPCIDHLSIKSAAITLYRLLMQAEIKFNVLSKLVYMTKLRNTDLQEKIEEIDVAANNHTLAYSRELKRALEVVQPLPHRSCDPNNEAWVRDESFYDFNGFLRPTIFQYNEFCGRIIWRTDCSCDKILNEAKSDCSVSWLEGLQCNNKPIGCSYLGMMSVCVGKENQNITWLTTDQHKKLNVYNKRCPEETERHMYVPEYSPEHYRACYCKCADKAWKIYNGMTQSRTNLNYVIVSVRFKRNNDGVLFLQAAQGKLGRNGGISDVTWLPLPTGSISVDEISYNSYNAIFLDELQLDDGYVLTGIRLAPSERVDRSNKIKGIGLSIQGVLYDYRTGKLNSSYTKTIEVKTHKLKKLLRYKVIHPLHTGVTGPNKPSPTDVDYVKFEQTHITADYGGSVLPLLDATPVIELLPLRGLGIYHKGTKDHSGFVSLSLYHIDYVKLLDKFIEKYEQAGEKLWKEGILLKNNYFV